jgi:aminoglycoside phosphotransferase (APT) family kinase protein
MFTRPDELTDAVVTSVLVEAWGITPAAAEYLPVGFGSHHWAVRTSNGERWFLTVDDLGAKRHHPAEPLTQPRQRLDAALRTAQRLRDAGLAFVVAPRTTTSGGLLASVPPHFEAALYPWIEGRSHPFGEYASEADRSEVVELLAALHRVDPSTLVDAGHDDFAVPNREELLRAIDEADDGWDTGPFGDRARLLLRDRAEGVVALLQRYDRLAQTARDAPDRRVATHGEPHAANTISTAAGRLLIDWDTVRIAPPERDLWMVLDGGATLSAAYEARTGIRPLAPLLEMYRLLWDLTEIAGYTAFFRAPHAGTADAVESWENLVQYLDVAHRWPRVHE